MSININVCVYIDLHIEIPQFSSTWIQHQVHKSPCTRLSQHPFGFPQVIAMPGAASAPAAGNVLVGDAQANGRVATHGVKWSRSKFGRSGINIWINGFDTCWRGLFCPSEWVIYLWTSQWIFGICGLDSRQCRPKLIKENVWKGWLMRAMSATDYKTAQNSVDLCFDRERHMFWLQNGGHSSLRF